MLRDFLRFRVFIFSFFGFTSIIRHAQLIFVFDRLKIDSTRNYEYLNADHLLNKGLQQKVDRNSSSLVEKHVEAVGFFNPNAIGTTRVSDTA